MIFGVEDLVYLLLLGIAAWFWKDSLQAREQVLAYCKRHTREMDVQLLDQSVNASRITLRRDLDGRIKIARLYRFEFSIRGDDRREGQVAILGRRITSIYLDMPEGRTITPRPDSEG